MAPGAPNQKRGRGGPRGARKDASTASGREPDHGPKPAAAGTSVDANAVPRNRGRPRKSIDSVAQEEAQTLANEANQTTDSPATMPKKKGRPSKTRDAEQEEEIVTETRPRKRRRPEESGEKGDDQVHGEGSGSSRAEKRVASQGQAVGQAEKKKGRPRRKPASHSEQAEEQSPVADETSARRSQRDRRSAGDKPWWAGSQASAEVADSSQHAPAPQKRKGGRPSLAEVPISKAQNQPSPPHTDQATKKGRGRSSRISNSPPQPTQQPPTKPPKKTPQPRQPPSEPSPAPPQPPAPYRHLTTLTRQIPRSTIASKWQPLPAPSITAISTLLTDASRPVLHRLRAHTTRHAQAQSVLRTFSAGLHRKLARGMPFPPASIPTTTSRANKKTGDQGGGGGGHAVELDFERVVDGIAALERTLDPLLHSVALLTGEKEREERALEREYKELRRLEGDARAVVRGWREGRGKGREHVLVPPPPPPGGTMEGMGMGVEVVKRGNGEGGGVFKDLQEEELLALSQQIGSHMESMRSNLGQIEGVVPAIARSRAALQGTLCEYLDPEQYEQVLLG